MIKQRLELCLKYKDQCQRIYILEKNVDSNVLSRVESVNKTATEYINITNKLDDFQYQFNKLFWQ